MRIAITFCIAAILLMAPSARAASPAELRATAQKSIQFVKAKGVYWIESKKCASSHRIGNMVWGLTAAQKGGLQVSDQLDDGGWGWNLDEASNALATGMAFYALSKAKPTKLNSNSIIKDRDFLVSTQNNNGSWRVNRTKINKRDAPIETSIYWGATWALLGLSETMT